MSAKHSRVPLVVIIAALLARPQTIAWTANARTGAAVGDTSAPYDTVAGDAGILNDSAGRQLRNVMHRTC